MSEQRQEAVMAALKDRVIADGWVAWSVHAGTLIALCSECAPRLIYVTTGTDPFGNDFRPSHRKRLLDLAERAGAQPWIVWWPRHGHPQWIAERDWPPVGPAEETNP